MMSRPRPPLLAAALATLTVAANVAVTVAAASGEGGRTIRYQGIEATVEVAPVDHTGDPRTGDPRTGDPRTGDPRTGRPRAGEPIGVRLAVRDAATSTPIPALTPAAWLERVEDDGEVGGDDGGDDGICRRRGESFLGGSLLTPPAVDLNVYSVVTLDDGGDDGGTLSVLEPRFGYGGNRLTARVPLPAPGADWALDESRDRLFVSLPAAGRVAVVDTVRWRVSELLEVGPGPRRLALQPDRRYLWVARDLPGADSGVTAIDAAGPEVVGHLATGAGAHHLALSGDGRHLFVTNRDAGTTTVVDVAERAKVADVETGERPTSVAWSEAAEAAYVVDEAGGVVVVDPLGRRPPTRVEVPPGVGELRFAPGGRLGFLVDPGHDRVHLLDAARNRVVQTAEVEPGPDRVSFSDDLAYVRHRGSEIVLMIPLDAVGREGEPVPVVDFPGGQNPFGGSEPAVAADGIVQVPGAGAVLVANPLDRAVYYYKEGMAAPMGGFPTGDRQPRAVLALDRSLRERAPGVYATTLAVERPGRYRLVLYLDSPRLVRCFEVVVAPGDGPAASPPTPATPRVETLGVPEAVTTGERVELRFRLTDPETGRPLDDLPDLRLLTFRAPGRGRRHLPIEPAGNGVHTAPWTPTAPGVHYFFLESPSRGLHAGNRPALTVTVSGEGR